MTDTSGLTSYAPFARWDHDSQSWRTSEATCLWDLTLSSLTLPQWGGLHDGELCEHPTPERLTSGPDYSSLPTPNAADGKRNNLTHQRGEGNPTLLGAVHYLPTPTKGDGEGGGKRAGVTWESTTKSTGNGGASRLRDVVSLLPTPAVNDMGRGKTPDEWDAWTAKMQAAHGNGNGHGKSLEIEAQRLLPTPAARDAKGPHMADRNGGLCLARTVGETTGQPSPDGSASSDDPHQPQLSLDGLALPA
jgi:hypothetical protein